jgi:hypothetical protein
MHPRTAILRRPAVLLVAMLMLLSLVACGPAATPATLGDIPAYPDAKALQPGENQMADTLAQNVQMAGQMGQKLDQKIFTLPKDASWDQVKGFYSEKLSGSGWSSTSMPIPDNEMTQMSLWTRGTQSLTMMRLTEPISKDTFLLFSLASQ